MAVTCRSALVGVIVVLSAATAGCGHGRPSDGTESAAAAAPGAPTATDEWGAGLASEPIGTPAPAAPPPEPTSNAPQGGRLRGLLTDELGTWNGTDYSGPAWVVDLITCNTLMGYRHPSDTSREPTLRPEIAAAPPDVSADGKTYTFRIRNGVRFSDGRELVPDDVKGSFLRMFDRAANLATADVTYYDAIDGLVAYRAGEASDIAGIDVGHDTVTFSLAHPDGSFVDALAMAWACIVPADAPHLRTDLPPPMTGPYMVTRHVWSQSATIDRNPMWGENVRAGVPVDPGTFNVDGFDIDIDVPPVEQLRRIQRGDADFSLATPPDCCLGSVADALSHDAATRSRFHVDVGLQVVYATLDVHAKPFDDPRVRRALNYAVDRRAIVRAAGGDLVAEPLSGLLPPGLASIDGESDVYPTEPDLQHARALLREAGIRTPIDAGTMYLGRSISPPDVGHELAADLARIGIRMRVVVRDTQAFYSILGSPLRHDDAIGIATWMADTPDPLEYLSLLTSVPSDALDTSNYGGFSDPAYDAALARIGRLPHDAERFRQAARLAHQVEAEQAPWIPLYRARNPNLVSERYGGYAYDALRGISLARAFVNR